MVAALLSVVCLVVNPLMMPDGGNTPSVPSNQRLDLTLPIWGIFLILIDTAAIFYVLTPGARRYFRPRRSE